MRVSTINSSSQYKQYRKQTSFEGIGKVTTIYQRLENNGNVNKKLFNRFIKKYGEQPLENLIAVLKQNGIMDDSGNLIKLMPKKIIIEDGNDMIIDCYKAKDIEVAGGILNEGGQLEADTVNILGGTVKADINAKKSMIQQGKDTKVLGNITAKKMKAVNTTVHNLSGDTKTGIFKEDGIFARLEAYNSKLNGTITAYIDLYGKSSLTKKAVIHGHTVNFHDNSSAQRGYFRANEANFYDNSSVGNKVIYFVSHTNLYDRAAFKNIKCHLAESLNLHGKSIINKTSDVIVDNSGVKLYNQASIRGKLSTGTLQCFEESYLSKTSEVNTDWGQFYNNSSIRGALKLQQYAELHDNAKISKTAEVKGKLHDKRTKTSV